MLSWVSVNANTGSIIVDLPTLRLDGALKRTIGRHESQTATLPLDGAPSNWKTATREKSVFLVALTDPLENEPRGLPVWGGMVTEAQPNEGSELPISMITAEDYLNDRYVRDETFFTWPQNDIVEELVLKYVADDGIPIRVVKLPGANPVRGRTYADKDDKTVYAILEELAGISGGPEWTIEWEWVDEQKLGLVLYVGERIGSPAPAGLGPASWFYLPGNVSKARLNKGYRRGEGANDVMATSSGSADARPQSSHHISPNDGRPKIEFRWSPSTSITDQGTLEGHAARALAGLKDGTRALSITANREETTPFNLGDDVGFDLTSWAWPAGITGTARAIGIEWTDTTITPVVDVTGIEGID
jgi:hypothetical protein